MTAGDEQQIPPGYGGIVLQAMRPHFFAFPVGAALAGASVGTETSAFRVVALCVTAALGWGVGQLLNDLLDKEADKVDAPHRPAPQGLLPLGPTLAFACFLGLLLVTVVSWLHRGGFVLSIIAMLLIATYNQAKRVPLLGNLSHALVIATAALIGAAAANPTLDLDVLLPLAAQPMLLSGIWAALYLQSNYEKDRRGDAIAGYHTLAHVLGIRSSAALRASSGLAIFTLSFGLPLVLSTRILLGTAVAIVVVSALRVACTATEREALVQYRWAIHGGTIGMLGLGAGAVPITLLLALIAATSLLTELAFAHSSNP